MLQNEEGFAGAKPSCSCIQELRKFVLWLPAELDGELELPCIVGGGGLASLANGTGGWVAELVDGGDVGAIG